MNDLKIFLRIMLGLLLIATGVGKLLDIPGFIGVIEAYDLLPAWSAVAVGYLLPFVELVTGIGLVFKMQTHFAAWSAVGLHVIFLTGVIITLVRGLELDNCGCFGVFWARPLTLQTVFEDSLLLLISIFLLWSYRPSR